MLLFGSFGVEIFIYFAIVIFFAFAYHEYAHAITADRLGDPTPRRYGRITLNPFPHISLAGYVMVLLIGFGGAFTPVNPSMLRGDPRKSHAIVAVAGPIANILMAMLFSLPIHLVDWGVLQSLPFWDVSIGVQQLSFSAFEFCLWGVRINVLLAVFNMLPIPPLDGFTILQGLLPREMASQLDILRRYGLLIFFAVFLILPNVGIDIFGGVMFPLIQQIESILLNTQFF